jgi:GNAT superfamily N-acetyltransferase
MSNQHNTPFPQRTLPFRIPRIRSLLFSRASTEPGAHSTTADESGPTKESFEPYLLDLDDVADGRHNERIRQALHAENERKAGESHFKALNLTLRDAFGGLAGGLVGSTSWNWLYVETLWVDPAARGRGFGAKLLHHAEGIAKRRGCKDAYLETFSFEGALPFYEKHDYVQRGSLTDFPTGHTKYLLHKELRG